MCTRGLIQCDRTSRADAHLNVPGQILAEFCRPARRGDQRDDIIFHGLRDLNSGDLGARIEYRFQPNPPRNGTEALDGVDHKLDRLIHLYFLNRAILVTPFHNMLLISPETTAENVDRHTAIFTECAGALTGRGA